MTPLMQLNRQLQHLFTALLLAFLAIAQSAQAVRMEAANASTVEEGNALAELRIGTENGAMGQPTSKKVGPNKWVIKINFTKPLPECAGGNVIVHADLVVEHGKRLRLEGFNGVAVTGNRKLVPTALTIFKQKIKEDLPNGDKVVEFKNVAFKVNVPGLPGARPSTFKVDLSFIFLEIRDGKITHLKPGSLDVFCP
jgi:hypothetical protein